MDRARLLERTPEGTQICYLTNGVLRVLGQPPDGEDENGDSLHNCDAMGCGQEHVIRLVDVDAAESTLRDLASLLGCEQAEVGERVRELREAAEDVDDGAALEFSDPRVMDRAAARAREFLDWINERRRPDEWEHAYLVDMLSAERQEAEREREPGQEGSR